MDCLRSFAFRVNTNGSVSGVNLVTWTSGSQQAWQVQVGTSSTYNIFGFKNIDVYGITMLGTIQTFMSSSISCITNNWSIDVLVDGQQSLVGGDASVVPNFYGITPDSPDNNIFSLSQYSNSFMLGDPIKSVKNIQLQSTYAQGIAPQSLVSINLYWNLDFIIYYKYEGE